MISDVLHVFLFFLFIICNFTPCSPFNLFQLDSPDMLVSFYCNVELKDYDGRIQELFTTAALDAAPKSSMNGMRDHITEKNQAKLKILVSSKFRREWPDALIMAVSNKNLK